MPLPTVRIGLNPHWYSQFWIKQFFQLWRGGEIKLRPLLAKRNPYASFYFEVNGRPCLIDVHDKKELQFDAVDYFLYFKANFSSTAQYPPNVRRCWNGTTLKRANVPPQHAPDFDLIFISSITGGRHHKIALYEVLAALPLKKKLVIKMWGPDDVRQWGDYLTKRGIEVITGTWPYTTWLEWQKRGRWCVLTRGKHDCLSFKMIDYMSIGAAVVADYTPTSEWPVPVKAGENFLDLQLPAFAGDEMANIDFDRLRELYAERVQAALPSLRDDALRARIGQANLNYFKSHIADGAAARYVMEQYALVHHT
ncbi:MAG TPA: hypothetical protein VJC05_00370 [Candidatus Andersenbacteria bacterium]|nr:hypothetical protein [Candidatus Andersenbacteria bacterium]